MKNISDKHSESGFSTFVLTRHEVRADEAALWNSFRAGRRESLDAIFEKYVRVLYAYGVNITRDHDLIADCIQDIFLELWIKRSNLSKDVSSIKYYLIRTVRRKILRKISAAKTRSDQPIPEDYANEIEFNIESSLIQSQLSQQLSGQLKASVATLSQGQQEAIYLKFYENMTYEEVASVMHTSIKGVYNLIGKALISLRKYFLHNPIHWEWDLRLKKN